MSPPPMPRSYIALPGTMAAYPRSTSSPQGVIRFSLTRRARVNRELFCYPRERHSVPKVLVIDDDAMVRDTITFVLQRNGFNIATAEDGDQGALAYRRERPDVVITDIIMPQQEGLGMIVRIRREHPGAKIIAISGGGRIGNIDVLAAARTLGVDDIIAKPFEPEELLDRVNRVIALPSAARCGMSSSTNESIEQRLRHLARMARTPVSGRDRC
jgi:two-component system, chemotaxis family, chemotaxis protein CheY